MQILKSAPPPPPNNTYPTKRSNAILDSYFQEWPLPLLKWWISIYWWTHLMSISIMYQDQQLRIMPCPFLTRLRADCAMCRPSELSCFKPCDTSRAELHIVASLSSLKYMGDTNRDCVNNPYYCTVSCYISVILMPVSTTVSHKEHPFNHSCALFCFLTYLLPEWSTLFLCRNPANKRTLNFDPVFVPESQGNNNNRSNNNNRRTTTTNNKSTKRLVWRLHTIQMQFTLCIQFQFTSFKT